MAEMQPTQNGGRAIVLVHGGFHGAWCLEPLVPLLQRRGLKAIAIDLPGHGVAFRPPAAFHRRPFDSTAFMRERSSIAGITMDDYAAAVGAAVDDLIAQGYGPITVLGAVRLSRTRLHTLQVGL